ncbi:hypothetical protein [Nodularia spumigena]|jgi:ribosome-interacting GTPase 1|uniref:Uncharacterized protein n=1 Tax=Nodularia spumigena UHCC 0060 TaxID=3110300 RepID=A0ABU5UYA6_NODSP|nr:hypothetical protein [Nodularia spumigena]MEA5523966.1 hypothetical protein [Nodularia spumigena UHCC 0143]MEA5610045.1 hypothetical protein [Nodularia spumigena UHCC 0060]
MNRTPKSRSVAATEDQIKIVRKKMAELKKPEEKIKNQREKNCWTQEYLAEKSCCS